MLWSFSGEQRALHNVNIKKIGMMHRFFFSFYLHPNFTYLFTNLCIYFYCYSCSNCSSLPVYLGCWPRWVSPILHIFHIATSKSILLTVLCWMFDQVWLIRRVLWWGSCAVWVRWQEHLGQWFHHLVRKIFYGPFSKETENLLEVSVLAVQVFIHFHVFISVYWIAGAQTCFLITSASFVVPLILLSKAQRLKEEWAEWRLRIIFFKQPLCCCRLYECDVYLGRTSSVFLHSAVMWCLLRYLLPKIRI